MATVFLSTRAVAKRYDLARATVCKMAERGILPPGIRLGRTRRWALQELEDWERDLQQKEVLARDQRQEALAKAKKEVVFQW